MGTADFVFLCFFKESKGPSINITEFLQPRYSPEKLSFNDWLLTSPYQTPGLYGCPEGQRNVLSSSSFMTQSPYQARQYKFMI